MPGADTPSSGYLTITSAMTTAVYPTDRIGGSSTTAANSIFTANSRIIIDSINTDTNATTAGTVTIRNHAGDTVVVLNADTASIGRTTANTGDFRPGNGLKASGLSAISATTVGAQHKVFYTILEV